MSTWELGNIIAVSQLAAKVYVAYQDASDVHRHISEEVMSLRVTINMAIRHFKSTTFSDNDQLLGQEVLEGCKGVLEDLNSLIENYLASGDTHQALKRVHSRIKDVTALKARLISNTTLFNGFIQRFDIPLTTIMYIMLMSLLQLQVA